LVNGADASLGPAASLEAVPVKPPSAPAQNEPATEGAAEEKAAAAAHNDDQNDDVSSQGGFTETTADLAKEKDKRKAKLRQGFAERTAELAREEGKRKAKLRPTTFMMTDEATGFIESAFSYMALYANGVLQKASEAKRYVHRRASSVANGVGLAARGGGNEIGYAMFNSEEHQKWLWQPCELFVPNASAHVCTRICKERMAAGKWCDFGAIRLTSDPRNVVTSAAGHFGIGGLGIADSDTFVNWDEKKWGDMFQRFMWRFGTDGTITTPGGLYLTATQQGYVGLHESCEAPNEIKPNAITVPLSDGRSASAFLSSNFGAGSCCTESSQRLIDEVKDYCRSDRVTGGDIETCSDYDVENYAKYTDTMPGQSNRESGMSLCRACPTPPVGQSTWAVTDQREGCSSGDERTCSWGGVCLENKLTNKCLNNVFGLGIQPYIAMHGCTALMQRWIIRSGVVAAL